MWVVCQIGAREHYAIPRTLHREGELAGLITDFWVPPGSLRTVPGLGRLIDRYHPDLGSAKVVAPNVRMLAFEVAARARNQGGWKHILKRNALFQRQALRLISELDSEGSGITLFSYSYAALELFREAKRRGWTTVLGQIDPGPGEDVLVKRLRTRHPDWAGTGEESPPAEYWDLWREECELADRIVVNSAWSEHLLVEAGVEASKIEIVPLALNQAGNLVAPQASSEVGRNAAPLRLLFLGQAIVRKGIQDLVEAAGMLGEGLWQIDVVGPHGELPEKLPDCLQFHGGVPRSEAASWYETADVFVLPTHSDGFALTQLEAMAHGVPVIATSCCGEVVVDGKNGWIIPAGDAQALAKLLRKIAADPEVLDRMKRAARETAGGFGLKAVAEALLASR